MSEDMLEYLFFTRPIAQRFTTLLTERNIPWVEAVESVQEAILIKIAEGIDDTLWDELDKVFDELSVLDQTMLESGLVDDSAISSVGIYLQLQNGQQTIAPVDPEVVSRILSVISMDELNTFLDIVVRSVEMPDDSAICQR